MKGGLKVDIGVAAFLPGSHADLRPARNLDRFIGQRARFAILKFNRSRGNVVVSRRAVMERERSRSRTRRSRCSRKASSSRAPSRTSPTTAPSSTSAASTACCTSPTCRGAASGIRPRCVNVGDKVRVVVLKYDPERERVSLGMKQIMPDPWHTVAERFAAGPEGARQGREPHRLRRLRRAREGRRGSDPRLRDVVDEARQPSVEGAEAGGRGRRASCSTSIRPTAASRSA